MNDTYHGGNIYEMSKIANCLPHEILDFSASINPCGFPDWFRLFMSSKLSSLQSYPDPEYTSTKQSIASRYHISKDEIALGNGSSELLFLLPQILNIRKAILPIPSYLDYAKALNLAKVEVRTILLREENDFLLDFDELEKNLSATDLPQLVILGNPNNPTGQPIHSQKLRTLARQFPECYFIVDESFINFTSEAYSLREDRPTNVIILWSMTKILALPGLRVGFALGNEQVTKQIHNSLPPWSMNFLAAQTLERAMQDTEFFEMTRRKVEGWKETFLYDLKEFHNFKVFSGSANFLLLKSFSKCAKELNQLLLEGHRIGIRDCKNIPGLGPQFLRVAVKTEKENQKLVAAFWKIFSPQKFFSFTQAKKTPALMLQGTGSNVGKSILTAALCRIFYQDGIHVAPFKSQNMALNSYVTINGEELGRAQALQAQACGLMPDIRMNPILLKPSCEKGSQVIVKGKPIAHMDFRDYSKYKPIAFEEVKKCYNSLASEYNLVVIEGAGSASEINLKSNDIVNMRVAQEAQAEVIIVGNIDQGGVFGSLIGTMETLTESERNRVAGFIINRFRGIPDLLKGGIDFLEDSTGKGVFGVVPYLKDLSLPEEDSLEFKSGVLSDSTPLGNRVDIAFIDTPRLSNHTDIHAFKGEKDVRLRIVQQLEDFGDPDVIILGGSKNVFSDLQYLHQSGLAEKILSFASQRKAEIVGICGGFQILGQEILDPHHIESNCSNFNGLGLLPIETFFNPTKTLLQSQAIHHPSGISINGYEIHHGVTKAKSPLNKSVIRSNGEIIGYSNIEGNIWGSYLHGIFDQDEFRRWFIDRLRIRKGMNPIRTITFQYELESQLNNLAKEVRNAIAIDKIYRLLGI